MKEITLTNSNKLIKVDDEDYQYLNQWEWRLGRYNSILRGTRKNGIYKSYYIARQIMQTPNGMDTDHINGDRLDNRRTNLRICTHSENMRNKRAMLHKRFKGVNWYKRMEKWIVKIRKDKKDYHIGYFDSEVDAAKAYNIAAIKYHGEFARLNIIN